MQVITREGRAEAIQFDKILAKIKSLANNLHHSVDPDLVAKKTIEGMKDGITTTEIDQLSADIAANFTTLHPDYSILANRIWVSRIHKQVDLNFAANMQKIYDYINPLTGQKAGMISDRVNQFIQIHATRLNSLIDYSRDYNNLDYFGLKKLESGYLIKLGGKLMETPQQMWLRVACGIWFNDIDQVETTYEMMSQGYFTHATPTLFNAGTKQGQLSSCFLLDIDDDSLVGDNYKTGGEIRGIYKTLADTAALSKGAGGIGVAIHKIRSKGSIIKSTGGKSNGIIPMLKVFNETARYVDQGGGKRKGSFAFYLEPWHADIFDFLDLRKNTGKDEIRARDLFFGLWMPDLFMKRVENQGNWTLFDPNESSEILAYHGVKPLWELYGEEFEKAYLLLENNGVGNTVKAVDLWEKILEIQIETGMPYILYKDACNKKNNQKNLGTLKSSNLCAEILLYTDSEQVSVCNLASVALPKMVENGLFDFQKLYNVVYQMTINLNRVIDINYYPIKETKYSNSLNRPIGIGVQGLADTFHKLKIGFTSEPAKKLNKEIFETIYFAALSASNDLAGIDGSYRTYNGSPTSQGILQYDLWGKTYETEIGSRWDWKALKEKIKQTGLRNSHLTALMPTASTSVILGNNESFEPYTFNIYIRRVLNGEIKLVNPHLVRELADLNIWNPHLANQIILNEGSVQNIEEIPQDIQERYKTVWELKSKDLIDMSADRAAFICHTQSMNHFVADCTIDKLHKIHFYTWKKGLKTGSYYVRTRALTTGAKSLGIRIEQTPLPKALEDKLELYYSQNTDNQPEPQNEITNMICSLTNPDCEACSA